MSCEPIRADLDAYLDGEIEEARAAELSRHLAGCAECRRALAERRAVAAAVQRLGGASAPAGFLERFRAARAGEALPAAAPRPRRPLLRLSWAAGGAVAAAAALLFTVSLLTAERRIAPGAPCASAPAGADAERNAGGGAGASLTCVDPARGPAGEKAKLGALRDEGPRADRARERQDADEFKRSLAKTAPAATPAPPPPPAPAREAVEAKPGAAGTVSPGLALPKPAVSGTGGSKKFYKEAEEADHGIAALEDQRKLSSAPRPPAKPSEPAKDMAPPAPAEIASGAVRAKENRFEAGLDNKDAPFAVDKRLDESSKQKLVAGASGNRQPTTDNQVGARLTLRAGSVEAAERRVAELARGLGGGEFGRVAGDAESRESGTGSQTGRTLVLILPADRVETFARALAALAAEAGARQGALEAKKPGEGETGRFALSWRLAEGRATAAEPARPDAPEALKAENEKLDTPAAGRKVLVFVTIQ